jgi:hypothetical protein
MVCKIHRLFVPTRSKIALIVTGKETPLIGNRAAPKGKTPEKARLFPE